MLGVSVKRIWSKAGALKLKKSAAYWIRTKRELSERAKSNIGLIAHQMKPGDTPWNIGKSYIPGGRCSSHWFRKGDPSKRWNLEDYAIGALRIDRTGDFQIKVANNHWESMGRYAWFLKTRRWPRKDCVVLRKNGDHFDVRDENLECVTRKTLIRRNSYWTRYPREVARLFQLKGAIKRQVNRIRKAHEPEHHGTA